MKSFLKEMTLSPQTLEEARGWVIDRVRDCKVGDEIDLLSVEIATGEICQNIIRYAYEGSGAISLRVSDLNVAVGITVFDGAAPSDSDTWVSNKPQVDGGLGLKVLKNAVDAYSFRRLLNGNRASIYFFSHYAGFSSANLAWAGQLLEASACQESIGDWVGIVEAQNLVDRHVIQSMHSLNNLIIDHELLLEKIPEYHNSEHFRDVLINTIHWVEVNSPDRLTSSILLVSALAHDICHPGIREDMEDGVIEQFSAQIFREHCSREGLLNQKEIDGVVRVILNTQSSKLFGQHDNLSRLFNWLDIEASSIESYGLENASRIVRELGVDGSYAECYREFTKTAARLACQLDQKFKYAGCEFLNYPSIYSKQKGEM